MSIVASLDSSDGKQYSRELQGGSPAIQQQPWVTVRYSCEKNRYRR
jgi:hypothetical protein